MAKNPNLFVRFLGESTAHQSAYGFIWPLNANYMFEILNRMLKRVILDLLLYLVFCFKLKIRKAVVKKIVPSYQKKFPIKQKSLHNKTYKSSIFHILTDAHRNRKWMLRLLLNSVKPSSVRRSGLSPHTATQHQEKALGSGSWIWRTILRISFQFIIMFGFWEFENTTLTH